MGQPAYSAASHAAQRIHPNLLRLRSSSTSKNLSPIPSPDTINSLLETAFWASLRREEGYEPRISLAYMPPEQIKLPLRFEKPLPFVPHSLSKIAPAVERPGIHLGVWEHDGALCVWGATRKLPAFTFVIEVVGAGVIVVKQSRTEGTGKFVNVAVIEGDQIKIIDERAASLPDCPNLLTSLLGLESRYNAEQSSSILIQLAISMRSHKRGGSLLVVPADSETWRESILQPITYLASPAYSMLTDIIKSEPQENDSGAWKESLRRSIDGIAGSTAVDGATIINDKYELLAFGAKIIQRGTSAVPKVVVTEPIEGSQPIMAEPSHLGGTRHFSAAQFAYDQQDTIALIASQDGRFTVFGWSPCNQVVQAHRLEVLLL